VLNLLDISIFFNLKKRKENLVEYLGVGIAQ
jgi:hypothetical protein